MPEFQFDTECAIEAARAAGNAVLAIYRTDFDVTEKEPGQILTQADMDADAVIREILEETGYPILSEESADDLRRLAAPRVWIVDPLDGTSDFANRTGEFSIMIALVENHKPIAGAVYAPATSTLCVAEKGKGAFCFSDSEWKPLRTSAVSDMRQARAVVSRHHFTDNERAILHQLGVQKFVRKGSAGLKITDIAGGSADLYFTVTNKIKQWDTAAGYCILTEAGGCMTDMLGCDLVYNTEDAQHQNGILATNGLLQGAVIQTYNDLH